MQIFDELKACGLQEVSFISMDGVTGLEEGAKAIFPEVVVHRYIVHHSQLAKVRPDQGL